MDQVHARALEALQPFILLAKSTSASSPRFIANIITNATSSPQTYVFAELLELPTVQALRSPDTPAEFQGHLKLLEIFAWGTLQDYQGENYTYIPNQEIKKKKACLHHSKKAPAPEV
jgi:COP9 signalosome complex subunit 7